MRWPAASEPGERALSEPEADQCGGGGSARSCTIDRFFVDTNVLVYAFDPSHTAKHDRARAVLKVLGDLKNGVVSAQVLMEFFVVLTRKLSPAVPRGVAERYVEDFVRSWEVVPLDGAVTLEALRGAGAHGFSPWDAQIWAAARLNRVGAVLSEDFSDGLFADGVRFINPFSPAFQVDSLG